MEFSKLSSPSLKDLFVREIENMILSGQLSIGEQLPSEREMALQMEVSRAVINSGMAELASKGFVEIRPRIGAFVADYKRKGTVDTLLSILRYSGGKFRKNESKSLLEIRLALETLAIELAVPKMTEESLAVLQEILENFRRSDSPAELAESIFQFHHELCIQSGNTILPIIFYSFKKLAAQLWHKYFLLHGKEDLLSNTESLYQCIAKRDTKGAIEMFQFSLRKTIDGIVSIYE